MKEENFDRELARVIDHTLLKTDAKKECRPLPSLSYDPLSFSPDPCLSLSYYGVFFGTRGSRSNVRKEDGLMTKKLCLRLIGPVIFVLVFYFYVDFDQLKEIISGLRWHFFCLSVILVPALVSVRSLRWREILNKYDIVYSRWQCFRIYFVEMVAIMVVATLGTFTKVMYPRRDGYGLLRPILSVIADKYYDYLLPMVFGLTSAMLITLEFRPDVSLIILFCVSCLAFVPAKKAVMIFLPRIIPSRLNELFAKKGWSVREHFIEIHRALDLRTYALSVAGFGIYYLAVYLLNRSMSIDLTFSQVVLVMTITSLVTLLPISFFGVGTRDVGLVVVFKWFGRTPEEAVALSMALLLLRVAIVMMGSICWLMDPPPIIKLGEV